MTFAFEWSEDDKEWAAFPVEFPHLSAMAPTKEGALKELYCVVEELEQQLARNCWQLRLVLKEIDEVHRVRGQDSL